MGASAHLGRGHSSNRTHRCQGALHGGLAAPGLRAVRRGRCTQSFTRWCLSSTYYVLGPVPGPGYGGAADSLRPVVRATGRRVPSAITKGYRGDSEVKGQEAGAPARPRRARCGLGTAGGIRGLAPRQAPQKSTPTSSRGLDSTGLPQGSRPEIIILTPVGANGPQRTGPEVRERGEAPSTHIRPSSACRAA